MLDEPLGALDRALRRSLLDDLDALTKDLGLPIIYVTHDHEEALAIGDRVCVMRAGRVETVLPPRDLWQRPPTEFVLTAVAADSATFENPAHDFPKMIRYTRRPDGGLEARVGGAGGERPQTFVFTRQAPSKP